MIASLPMYDWPETRAANDRFWALIRDNLYFDGRPVPQELTRTDDPWSHWQDPELMLSQTCGLPYRARLHGKVSLVGTPIHDLPCAPGHYFSEIVARSSDARREITDFKEARLAVNDGLSQSGWAAPQALAQIHGFTFENVVVSGSHRESARMVAGGDADLAALDAVTWRLVRSFDVAAGALKVVAQTPATPALPYISAPGHDTDDLYKAIAAAIDLLPPADTKHLCLKGITFLRPELYLRMQTPDFPN